MYQALPPLIVGVKGDMYNITHGQSDNESVVQSANLSVPSHCTSLWESHMYPLVQWDGMDRWDSSTDYETVGQSVGLPCVPTGTVGWDGQVG